MSAYGLYGRMLAVAGQGDALAALLLEAAAALEEVAECRLYLVSREAGNRDAVWVVEVWESAEAHRRSLELDVAQELIARARPVLAGIGQRLEFEAIGGKGLATPG
jgi:quinol monooxygenase YgiN